MCVCARLTERRECRTTDSGLNYRERMRYRDDFLTVPEEEEKLTENYCVVYIKGGVRD